VVVIVDSSLTHQLWYKLAEKCSNNQAEQFAIVKALIQLRSMHTIQGSQRTTAIHTDSQITLEALANPRNHQSLVESIRKEIRTLEEEGWIVHFSWVKAHNDNLGNELATSWQRRWPATTTYKKKIKLQTTYHKYPKSAVKRELKCLGLQKWQSEWDSTNKGALTKTFFPTIKDRLTKRLQMNLNLSTVVIGHGKLRSYLHRFKIIDDPTYPCQMGSQSTEHLIRECTIRNEQRETLKTDLQRREGGGHRLTAS